MLEGDWGWHNEEDCGWGGDCRSAPPPLSTSTPFSATLSSCVTSVSLWDLQPLTFDTEVDLEATVFPSNSVCTEVDTILSFGSDSFTFDSDSFTSLHLPGSAKAFLSSSSCLSSSLFRPSSLQSWACICSRSVSNSANCLSQDASSWATRLFSSSRSPWSLSKALVSSWSKVQSWEAFWASSWARLLAFCNSKVRVEESCCCCDRDSSTSFTVCACSFSNLSKAARSVSNWRRGRKIYPSTWGRVSLGCHKGAKQNKG